MKTTQGWNVALVPGSIDKQRADIPPSPMDPRSSFHYSLSKTYIEVIYSIYLKKERLWGICLQPCCWVGPTCYWHEPFGDRVSFTGARSQINEFNYLIGWNKTAKKTCNPRELWGEDLNSLINSRNALVSKIGLMMRKKLISGQKEKKKGKQTLSHMNMESAEVLWLQIIQTSWRSTCLHSILIGWTFGSKRKSVFWKWIFIL